MRGPPLSTREKATLLGGGLGAALLLVPLWELPVRGRRSAALWAPVVGLLVGNELQNMEAREKRLEARLRSQEGMLQRQRRQLRERKLD
jgi:hypothetical protein